MTDAGFYLDHADIDAIWNIDLWLACAFTH